jgi:drug/metabolite transporter (DMT)-like permease
VTRDFLKLKNRTVIIGYASGVLASALFGSLPTIAKPILSNVNVLLLSSLVLLIAALTFTPLVRKSKTSRTRKDYGILIIVSVCGATLAPLLYFIGLNQSAASDTSLLSNAEIVFTVLLALIFFKERLKPVGFVAVGLVLFGVTIITTNLQVSSSLFHINSGHLLILGAAALWALDNNLSRIISTRIDSARLVQLKYAIGGVIILGIMFSMRIPFEISTTQIPYLVLLSVLGFGGSLYFFLQSLKRIGTIRTIVIFSMSSVFGLGFAGVFLHEQISVFQIIAIVIMLTGIYLINRKESMKEKEPTSFGF